jgi:esterase/lipase superfamily enzyme
MALLSEDKTDAEIRNTLRIGNVIIIGGDISHEEFGVAMADGLLRIPEQTTIYVSSADRALIFVNRLFHRERLGQLWADDLPTRTADFLGANPSLQFIDVTGAAGSTDGNGHNYFRQSPWVSSDLMALLAYNISAAERGLEKKADLPVWTFPPDFIERLRKAVAEQNPVWAGANGQTGSQQAAND